MKYHTNKIIIELTSTEVAELQWALQEGILIARRQAQTIEMVKNLEALHHYLNKTTSSISILL